MKEIKNILKAYEETDFRERKAVLATVVKVIGSSYRNPGARMLIFDNGRWVGSISGGCLEGDALRKAKKVMRDRKPLLVTYDTMDDDNNTLGIGLGCNGIIDVLLEPIDANTDPFGTIKHMYDIHKFTSIGVVALVYHSDDDGIALPGERLLLNSNQSINEEYAQSQLKDFVEIDLFDTFSQSQSKTKDYTLPNGGLLKVLFEIIEPTIELLIFGAGADAQPVTQIAKALGWKVKISDECIAHLAPINFPMADEMISCKRDYVHKDIEIGSYTAIILMSHNYQYDLEVLKQIAHSASPYIGILGPRKRTEKLFSALKETNIALSKKERNRIHTPVGLDIGAETADEIALSILSEILAKFSGRSGGFLKYHQGPIHKRQGTNDEVFKQVYLSTPNESQELG